MVLTRSQRTITLQSLPRELVAHCLEFLPFAEVQPYEPKVTRSYFGLRRILDAKRVSKNFRSAARYALTRGRSELPLVEIPAVSLLPTLRAKLLGGS